MQARRPNAASGRARRDHTRLQRLWTTHAGTLALLAGLLLPSLLSGCGCDSDGRSFSDGDVWTCSDGCNSCACDDGAIATTAILCPSPPGPAANRLMCRDASGRFLEHGTEVACDSACSHCRCVDGTWVEHCSDAGDPTP